ncbi:MAG: cell division protein FtsX [Ruminococcus sp. 37_24]|nr:MAG: cell division protein FtsX [Ruminococcus sp. 37_24]
MRKGFYTKLAASNIKKNSRTYIPYIITCIITAAMFYIINSLSNNESIKKLYGGETILITLGYGTYVTAIFAFIFLFYTNSFLMKRRKKEFGVLNILGMEKRHISKVLLLENIYIAFITMLLGIIIGMVLDKAMFLILTKMLGAEHSPGFYISKEALIHTVILFGIIFFCIYLNSLRQIHLSKPIELLNGGNVGEKEPKTKWFMAILGVICLAVGYYISVTSKNPVESLSSFLIAVILVIAGTYLIFIAGSIAFLKSLRKNKRYYYKTKHFTAVSGMIYRMKQNAVGLANICILSTMVLVMISSTSSLVFGMNDLVKTRYPNDITIYSENINNKENVEALEKVQKVIKDSKSDVNNEIEYSYIVLAVLKNKNKFYVPENFNKMSMSDLNKCNNILMTSLDDYNSINSENETLNDDEILIYSRRKEYEYSTIQLFDTKYSVKKKIKKPIDNGPFFSNNLTESIQIVVKNKSILDEMNNYLNENFKEELEEESALKYLYGFDINGSEDSKKSLYNDIKKLLKESNFIGDSECGQIQREGIKGLYGGMFFLGIFLGSIFTMATILIIYYKQISEGYEDKERFRIMQNVGMSHAEVKRSIHSQIMTVFFMPLIMAGIHVAFAFPIVKQILMMLNLTNTRLYIICTIVCFVAFTIIYAVIYSLTAKIYYHIVSTRD